MELLDIIQRRRSIRKYTGAKVEREKLDKILLAGVYAPNPGGRQGTKIIMLTDFARIREIGIINAACENRNWGAGIGVSAEQPSIIDDHTIDSGFYGCQALGIICVPKAKMREVNCIGSAFVCAQNMVLEAYALGVSSVIVGRAEATFRHPDMQPLLPQWGLSEDFTPLVFVCIGYIDGAYPPLKPRQEGRMLYIDA